MTLINSCFCFLPWTIVAGTPGPDSKHTLPYAVSKVNKQAVEGGPVRIGHSREPCVILKRGPGCRQESLVLRKTEPCSYRRVSPTDARKSGKLVQTRSLHWSQCWFGISEDLTAKPSCKPYGKTKISWKSEFSIFPPNLAFWRFSGCLLNCRKPRSMFTQPYSQIVEISGGSRAGSFYVTVFLSSLFNREKNEMLFSVLPSGRSVLEQS